MPDNRESRSVGDSLQLLFRHAPLILLAGIAGGLGAYLVAPSGGAVDVRAEATLGLTEEVGFPFYAQTRDRFAARAQDDGIADQILTDFGGTVTELRAEPSIDDNTRSNIIAAGSDEADVLAAADQLASELVELSRGEREERLTVERDALVADQDVLDAEIVSLTAELSEAVAAEAAARLLADEQTPATFEEDLIALRLAEQARDSARSRIGSLDRDSESLTDNILAADRAIASLDSDLVVVKEAEVIVAAPDDRSTIGVLGVLAGVVLSALAITTFMGGRAKVRRSTLEDRFPSAPVLGGDGGQAIAPFNADLWDAMIDGPGDVGVLRTATAADLDIEWMKRTELEGVIGSPAATDVLANATDIVVVCTPADRVATIEAIERSAASFSRQIAMIVINAG